MCKPRMTETTPREIEGGYEGQTIRLKQRHGMSFGCHSAGRHHFPWWSLWLIWPMMGLIKWIVPLMVNGVGMAAMLIMPLVPVLLIGLGVCLLRRR